VAEKESVANIYKHLKSAHGVSPVEKSIVVCWALQIASSEKGQVALSNTGVLISP
jgi:hypothetical protein